MFLIIYEILKKLANNLIRKYFIIVIIKISQIKADLFIIWSGQPYNSNNNPNLILILINR
jgi:hypothetical protein